MPVFFGLTQANASSSQRAGKEPERKQVAKRKKENEEAGCPGFISVAAKKHGLKAT